MSIAKLGLLESLSGRLGNLIVYEVNGQTRVRARNGSYKKSKSEEQKSQKSKFKHVAHHFSKLGSPLRETWADATKDLTMSGYNLFIKENIHNFNSEGEMIAINRFKICCGDLLLPAELRMTQLASERKLVEWEGTDLSNICRSSDLLQIAVYDPSIKGRSQIYWHKEAFAERSSHRCEFSLPKEMGPDVYLFAYFRSQYRTIFSDSFYLGRGVETRE